MAKYVLAGKSNCPFYARAEMVADELALRLPDFSVHKIVLKADEWDKWLSKTCVEKGWNHNDGSPIIWRELVNRGGKGILLGGCNDFLEMVKGYYNVTCSNSTEALKLIAEENRQTKTVIEMKEKKSLSSRNLFRIAVTNAQSSIAYSLFSLISSAGKLGKNIGDIALNLHYDEKSDDLLHGIVMELQDCAFSHLTSVSIEQEMEKVSKDSDLIIFISPFEDLEDENLQKLKNYAIQINENVSKNTKIIVVGYNATVACFILSHFCTNMQKHNLFALSRFEENKVKAALARKLDIITSGVSNVILWGSSSNMFIDTSFATAKGCNGAIWAPHIEKFSYSIEEIVYEKKWLDEELPTSLNSIESGSKDKNALSYSAAIFSQLQDIINPDRAGLFSLGLVSQGWYGIPDGLVFSFPVTYHNKTLQVVEDLNISESITNKLKAAGEELQKYCDELLETFH